MNHLELFSGIGGFRRAFDLITHDGFMDVDSIGYSEIDANALKTYRAVYEIADDEMDIGDIVEFTSNRNNLEDLPDFELLTGGFPCQPFSMMGAQQGFDEDRGQLFFRIMDILRERMPRFVLLENVKNLFTHDKGRTYKRIKSELESLGYHVISGIFNTADFHLPQKRNRVLIFATLDPIPSYFVFDNDSVKQTFDRVLPDTTVFHYASVAELLEQNVDPKYFLSDRIKPTILSDGTAGYRSRSEINQDIARPLTASMHKMHRACQDNYYSQDYIETHGRVNIARTHTKEEIARFPIRRITPEEAFALQGFPPHFASLARNAGVSDGALYKQAGNAVSVNTIYAVVYYLFVQNRELWQR